MIQVDDTIRLTEPGCILQMFDSYINIKTAEKQLQFTLKKCTVMYVGCESDSDPTGDQTVDRWQVEYRQNNRVEVELVETNYGKKKMEQVSEWAY